MVSPLCLTPECCVRSDSISKILDSLKALQTLLTLAGLEFLEPYIKDLEASRNALTKVIGCVEALNTRFKNVRRPEDVSDHKSVINTVVNMLNRIVEVRNLVLRVRDAVEERCDELKARGIECERISKLVDEATMLIDIETAKMVRCSLWLVPRLRVDRDDSGKLASAIATALFASMLSLHLDDIRRVYRLCFG